MPHKTNAVLMALVVAIGCVLPAGAQGFDARETQRRAEQTRAHMPNIGRAYSMRVTVGAHTNAGFEQSLTQSDPNLRHWTWVPVTSFDQAYIHVAPGGNRPAAGPVQTPKRPEHVYIKPVCVAAPHRTYDWSYLKDHSASSQASVSGKVKVAKAPESQQAGPALTKTYGGSYSDVSGRVHLPGNLTAMSSSKDVYGKLMTRTH